MAQQFLVLLCLHSCHHYQAFHHDRPVQLVQEDPEILDLLAFHSGQVLHQVLENLVHHSVQLVRVVRVALVVRVARQNLQFLVNPTEQIEIKRPLQQTKYLHTLSPLLPFGPIGPGGPAGPSPPDCPPVPGDPTSPCSPCGPDSPLAPASPLAPGLPFNPGVPSLPEGPGGPIEPLSPSRPSCPYQRIFNASLG